jgi:thymidylate synthase
MDMTAKQKILLFQQNQSGATKVKGIREFGQDRFVVETVDIDTPLPPVLDDAGEFLPDTIDADLVLDFLSHPDLSIDLGRLCTKLGIPVVASGKKSRDGLVITPPT